MKQNKTQPVFLDTTFEKKYIYNLILLKAITVESSLDSSDAEQATHKRP